tara:strand:- start:6331 stop:7236 length:906 start_codon:yes stop_codon:yes gene_type:complete
MANFISGYTIKPRTITSFGNVIFTDGTNDCVANQLTCEAYGYVYNRSRGICMAYLPQDADLVLDAQGGESNSKSGIRNEIASGGFYNDLNGVENGTEEGVQNSSLNGAYNVVKKDLLDVSVSGEYGKALRQGEILQGGGNYTYGTVIHNNVEQIIAGFEGCGYAQASVIQLTGRTTNDDTIVLKALGRGDIVLQTNCILGFEIKFTTLDQVSGEYVFYEQKGAIHTNDVKKATICLQEITDICNMSKDFCRERFTLVQKTEEYERETQYYDVEMVIKGCRDQNLIHHAVMNLYETRTNTTI